MISFLLKMRCVAVCVRCVISVYVFTDGGKVSVEDEYVCEVCDSDRPSRYLLSTHFVPGP